MVRNWKTHLSSMENEVEEQNDRVVGRYGSFDGPPEIEGLDKMIATNEKCTNQFSNNLQEEALDESEDEDDSLELEWLKYQEELRESRKTTITLPSAVVIDKNSVEEKIRDILLLSPTGLHLTEIMAQLEGKGWSSGSKYHKYSALHKLMSRNYILFEKIDKATFKIREANVVPKKIKTQNNKFGGITNHISSFTEIVSDTLKQYHQGKGLSVKELHNILRVIGFKCSEKPILSALEDKSFFCKRKDYYFPKSNEK